MSASIFAFLSEGPLAEAGHAAEQAWVHPDACLTGARRFGERLAERVVRRLNLPSLPREKQRDRLDRLQRHLPARVYAAFEQLRRDGNRAAHDGGSSRAEAGNGLRRAYELACWFEAEWGDPEARMPGFRVPDFAGAEARARAEAAARREAERERDRTAAQLAELNRRLALPSVGVADQLKAVYSELSPAGQVRMARFLDRFRDDPSGISLAEVTDAQDPTLRLAAIDDELSLAVAVAPRGDAYTCVWVGPSDRARRWATSHRVEIHPVLGSVQIYDVAEAEAAAGAGSGRLFAQIADDELTALGLPAPLLPSVRALDVDADLERLAPHLPNEATDALFMLASGYDYEATRAELGRTPNPVAVDVEDYEVALAHPESRQRIHTLALDEELSAVLDGSVEDWRLFLHPDQRRLVRMNARGPVRVLGGAGTGKTVALLHRAAWLATEVFPGERLLVTTFTRNLALALERQLRRMVPLEAMQRIDVYNVHRLARRLLPGEVERVDDDTSARLWREAMAHETLGRPQSFYRGEWARVVQAQGITTRGAYLRVLRKGRGARLGRPERRAVWAVLEQYRRGLDEERLVEPADIVRRARAGLLDGTLESPYRAVLADEVQDFSAEELRLLRALAPEANDDLFLAGDAHQRIYGKVASMKACGIAIVGRGRRLRVNYRTTQRIRDWAVAVLDGVEVDDLDGGTDTLRGYHSLRLGAPPEVRHFADADAERHHLLERLNRWLEQVPPEAICVAARTRTLARRWFEGLVEAGLPATVLNPDKEPEPGPGVRVSTLHRMKGLEFPRVWLASVDAGTLPHTAGMSFPDPLDRAHHLRGERCLLYVAATRARDELVVTGVGEPSPLLPS